MTQEILDDEDLMGKELAALRSERSSPDESVAVVEQASEPAPTESVAVEPVGESAPSEPAPEQTQAEAKPPTLDEQLVTAKAELHRMRSEIGRVDALNRKYSEAAREAAALREQIAQMEAAKAAQPESPSATASKLAAIADQVKEFPELAGIVAAVSDALHEADKKTAEVARQAAAQAVAPLEPLRREQENRIEVEQRAASDAALKQFNEIYPTAVEVVKSDDFKSWLSNQPNYIQFAFYKGQTPQDALSVMDTYDMHLRRSGLNPIAKLNPQQEPAVQQRSAPDTSRLQRAAGIPSRPTGSQGGQPPSDDFEASLAYFRQKRLAQARAAA